MNERNQKLSESGWPSETLPVIWLSVQGECHGRDQRGPGHGVGRRGRQRDQHHPLTTCALRSGFGRHRDHDRVGGHYARRAGLGIALGRRDDVDNVARAHQIDQRAVGRMNRHDAGVGSCRGLSEATAQHPHVGQHFAAARRAGQRGADDGVQVGSGSIGNRCRGTQLEVHIVGGQFGTGPDVARGHHYLRAGIVGIGP